jgi:formylglycine-generating enzyme required for sulfatase activity
MRCIKLLVAATALLMMAVSCGKDDPADKDDTSGKDDSVQVSEVTLNKETLALTAGKSETLTATLMPADATDKTVTWTSSASGVASVDASTGEVTAKAKGAATITATTVNGKEATCEVTVDYIVETVLIPKGTFLMGSSDGSAVGSGTPGTDPNATPAEPNRWTDETQHRVTLSRDYYMSKYPVTNAQYAAFLNAVEIDETGAKAGIQEGETLVSASSGSYDWGLHYANGRWEAAGGYENHPAINVSWYGAKAFAEWAGGDLPTEAQWERAARGGEENKPFGIGNGRVLTGDMANFDGRSPYNFDTGGEYSDANGIYLRHTTAVGSYSANAYGLYDMHGNVFEWCLDQWDGSDNYADLPATDPLCETGSDRVFRGGSWYSSAQDCRVAYRNYNSPGVRYLGIGFRVVLP